MLNIMIYTMLGPWHIIWGRKPFEHFDNYPSSFDFFGLLVALTSTFIRQQKKEITSRLSLLVFVNLRVRGLLRAFSSV